MTLRRLEIPSCQASQHTNDNINLTTAKESCSQSQTRKAAKHFWSPRDFWSLRNSVHNQIRHQAAKMKIKSGEFLSLCEKLLWQQTQGLTETKGLAMNLGLGSSKRDESSAEESLLERVFSNKEQCIQISCLNLNSLASCLDSGLNPARLIFVCVQA